MLVIMELVDDNVKVLTPSGAPCYTPRVNRHSLKPPSAFGRLASTAIAAAVLLSLAGAGSLPLAAAPARFADSAFQQLWERTDAPVAAGQAQRSWYWGPSPGASLSEPYSGGKTGSRLVQYFDKARMEVNNPQADRGSEWFVT